MTPRTAFSAGLIAGLTALNLIVFAQVRTHEFVSFDDAQFVTDNAAVKAGLTAESAK
ncbi:MAG: hypothetical protein JJE51_05790 [Thermoanaerobaculia bacterium]|nr:hypothetical protein [Thermoanaerobaculia bacterium]